MSNHKLAFANTDATSDSWCSQTLRDEIFGFLVAGHDTAGAVMQWTLRWLTAEQRVQRKIRSELRYVLEDHHDGGSLSAEVLCKADVSTGAAHFFRGSLPINNRLVAIHRRCHCRNQQT